MIFIVGVNLAMIVLAIIASSMFSSLAREKGYLAGKARRYVIIVCCAGLFMMMAGQSVISFGANLLKAKNGGFADALIYCWSGFILVVAGSILYIAYQNMKKAPDAGSKREG